MSAPSIPDRLPATPNDLWTSLISRSTHMELGCRLVFDGRLDADRLARAVRLSLDAEPVLGCDFETGWYGGQWRRREDLDLRVPYPVWETADSDVETEAVRFQAEPIGDEGPQARVRLLRAPDHDEICVKISHVVADGQAAKQYVYLLADIYSNLAEDPAYVPRPNLTPRPTGMDAWNGLTKEQQRAAKKVGSPMMPNWVVPHRGLTGEGRTRRELVLGPERFRAVKEYGRQRGASVNDMVLTAFFRALTHSFDPPAGVPLSFTSTADHRRYLPSAEGLPIANISISGFLAMRYVPGEGFDETLASASACMRAWRDTCYGVVGQKQMAGLARIGYRAMAFIVRQTNRMGGRSGKSLPILTNFGVVDEQKLVFAGVAPVAAHMLGPAPGGGSMVPTISTYRDSLTVSMGFCEADLDPAVIEGVLGAMDGELGVASGLVGRGRAAR